MRRSEERTQLWEDLIIGPSDPTPNTVNKEFLNAHKNTGRYNDLKLF